MREAESSEEPDQQEAPETKGSPEKPPQEGSKVPDGLNTKSRTYWMICGPGHLSLYRLKVLVLIT